MTESLFRDRTVSWVRVVIGINKYVTETSEEIPFESIDHVRTLKPAAKAKPRLTPAAKIVSCFCSYSRRKWIDTNPALYSQGCFEVSNFMITLLRYDETIPREDDGAVRFDALIEKFKVKFDGTSQWTVHAWITFLTKRRTKEKVSILLEPELFQTFLVLSSNSVTFRRQSR